MNKILSRFPILIAGTGLIINAYIFLFKFDGFLSLNNFVIYIFSGLIALAMGVLLFCLYKTFEPNMYQKIDYLNVLETKRKEYQNHELDVIKKNSDSDDNHQQKEVSADDLFQADIQGKFIECSTINYKLNNKRSEWFLKSLFLVWLNLALCITIPISTIVITHWNTSMSDEKKNPPPVPKPAETKPVAVRNVVPLNENFKNDSVTPSKDKKDKKDSK